LVTGKKSMRQIMVLMFLSFFFGNLNPAQAEVTAVIRGAVIRGAVITPAVSAPADPCQSVAVGDACSNGVLYAGTGFAGLGSYKYMTTPGHCSGFTNNYTGFTPTCTGAIDNLSYRWAKNDANPSACYTPTAGTTPCNVATGVTSTTAGASNTTTLAANYADTDATRYCENMTYPATNGYTDWYLPSKDELNLVLYAMKVAGKGNFVASYYWSSTEYSAANAWLQAFTNGSQVSYGKTYGYYVRCVRRY
jgi:hypothetical protein